MKNLLTTFCLLLFFTSTSLAQETPIDPTFGNQGISKLNALSGYKVMQKMYVDSDDRILCAGSSQGFNAGSTHFTVLRFSPDGGLDAGFGNNGAVYTPLGEHSTANDVCVQPDGKIIATGACYFGANPSICLIRYLANGTPDNTFGNNGIAILSTDQPAAALSIALQTDGKILVTGYTGADAQRDFILARLSDTGAPDPDFGNGGTVVASMPTNLEQGQAVKVLQRPDGKILVAGNYQSATFFYEARIFVAQFLTDGQFDTAFSDDGIWVAPDNHAQFADGAALLPDGRLVVAGTRYGPANGDFNLLAFAVQPDGSTDTFFGYNGFAVITPGGRRGFSGTGLAVKPDGSILIGANAPNGSTDPSLLNQDALLVQLNEQGKLDPAFNSTGYGFYPLLGYFSATHDLAVQANGRVLQLVQFIESANNTAIFGYLNTGSSGLDNTSAPHIASARITPNPWTSASVLQYELTEPSNVAIQVCDPLGRPVYRLLPGQQQNKGIHSMRLALDGLPSGLYTVLIETSKGNKAVRVLR